MFVLTCYSDIQETIRLLLAKGSVICHDLDQINNQIHDREEQGKKKY